MDKKSLFERRLIVMQRNMIFKLIRHYEIWDDLICFEDISTWPFLCIWFLTLIEWNNSKYFNRFIDIMSVYIYEKSKMLCISCFLTFWWRVLPHIIICKRPQCRKVLVNAINWSNISRFHVWAYSIRYIGINFI